MKLESRMIVLFRFYWNGKKNNSFQFSTKFDNLDQTTENARSTLINASSCRH